jgi:hypothetical protein
MIPQTPLPVFEVIAGQLAADPAEGVQAEALGLLGLAGGDQAAVAALRGVPPSGGVARNRSGRTPAESRGAKKPSRSLTWRALKVVHPKELESLTF